MASHVRLRPIERIHRSFYIYILQTVLRFLWS